MTNGVTRRVKLEKLYGCLANTPPLARALTLTLLAACSAVLGDWFDVPLKVGNVPLAPSIFFGVVLCIAVIFGSSWKVHHLLFIFFISIVAWIVAFQSAYYLYLALAAIFRPETRGTLTIPTINYLVGVCGAVGGFVGSSTIALGLATVSKDFKLFRNWSILVMTGTASGILLEMVIDKSGQPPLAIHVGSVLPLFLVWQISVAGWIGLVAKSSSDPMSHA